MTEDQKHIWEREKRAVGELRDGLGKPVDPAIVETVTVLRLLDFTTHSSCGGHLDRPASPYVAFRASSNQADRRFIEEAETQDEQRRRKDEAMQHNAAVLDRLLGYLERFYVDRDVPLQQRLICQGFGVIGYRLTTQSADLVHVATKDERHDLVDVQRQEFDAFTEFLKAEFFGTKDDAPSRAA
ncbi:hypothetical protein [Streptomyces sp. NPDC060002]|uniref:hypothetical protein n=1 Tax=Streptomyces sp. NPDC060002 TaxID=3347033 RepID=UPI0036B1ED0B